MKINGKTLVGWAELEQKPGCRNEARIGCNVREGGNEFLLLTLQRTATSSSFLWEKVPSNA